MGNSNSTFKFNEDGPVKVSEEDFQDYQAVAPKSFAAAYRVWIDDNFADDIRRLALRDLLRHDLHDNEISARRCFKLTQDAGWTRVEPELTSVLRYRPKLANELCRELEYCLEQNLFPYQQTLDFLIECILKTAREKTLCFWPFHSFAHDLASYGIAKSLLFCHPSNGIPEWVFQDRVWPRLQERAREEGWFDEEPRKSFYKDASINAVIVPEDEETILGALCEYVSTPFLCVVEHPEDKIIMETVAEWLDSFLPEGVLFVSHFDSLFKNIKLFKNEELAYKILRRHLVNLPVQTEKRRPTFHCEPDFLYWLKGLTLQIAPNDDVFLRKIDSFIASRDLIVS